MSQVNDLPPEGPMHSLSTPDHHGKVGILMVTHGKLGSLLMETITDLIGALPLATEVLEVRRVQATDVLLRQGERMLERLDTGAGVLILTDTYGSTPSNIANRLADGSAHTEVLAGLNLPMLLRLYNYPKLALCELAHSAAEGGQRGIVRCPRHAPELEGGTPPPKVS